MLDQDQKLLEAAAEKPRRRLRQDHEKASVRVKPLLAYIDDNLFDPKLTSPSMMEACKVRDHSMSTVFTRETGAPPTGYIRDRRMETAAWMLIETDLPIWKIGHLVFGQELGGFSAAFKRWSGLSPRAYRNQAHKAATEAESVDDELRRIAEAILEGGVEDLTPDQLDYLIRYLQAQREATGPPAPPALAIDGPDLERGVALSLWEKLRQLPAAEQKALVRQPYALRSTALFDVLREKSREEGRKDRQTGVRLAELAIASLDGVAAHLTSEELANKKAQGWAWLGNARRLALDYPAAERAFAKARKLLPSYPDPQALAQVCELEGELYLFQSRFDEALELKDRAVELFRSLGNNRLLAESLLSRATAIGCSRGFESAIRDFLEAAEVAELVKDSHLTACVDVALVAAHALAGNTEEALQRLPEAREHCSRTDARVLGYQLLGVEGFIARQQGQLHLAKERFLAARFGFLAAGEPGFAAEVDLDLAELFLEQGKDSEAVLHALRAIPVFEHFGKQPEAVAALALLADVGTEQAINLELIHTIRGHLENLAQNPMGLKNLGPGSPGPSDAPCGA